MNFLLLLRRLRYPREEITHGLIIRRIQEKDLLHLPGHAAAPLKQLPRADATRRQGNFLVWHRRLQNRVCIQNLRLLHLSQQTAFQLGHLLAHALHRSLQRPVLVYLYSKQTLYYHHPNPKSAVPARLSRWIPQTYLLSIFRSLTMIRAIFQTWRNP